MFIVIDGPDGCGKTTLAKRLTQRLCQEGHRAIYTYEPTRDSNAGRSIHRRLRCGNIPDIYNFANLFAADREEHLENLIQPSLDAGEWVICDRYKCGQMIYYGRE